MDQPLQRKLLDRFNLRVEPQMLDYLQRRLSDGGDRALPVIGGEARTGQPLRLLIDPNELRTGNEARGKSAS